MISLQELPERFEAMRHPSHAARVVVDPQLADQDQLKIIR
jgi:hypothetical protein